MNETTAILPEWVASQVDAAGAGGVDLQELMDEGPFRPSSIRTVAESGDFEVVAGRVRRRGRPDPEVGTWLPAADPRVTVVGAEYLVAVTVTEDMLEQRPLVVPHSIAALLEVPRGFHRALDSRLGKRALYLHGSEARLGPVSDFLADLGAGVGERVHLVFTAEGHVDVRR